MLVDLIKLCNRRDLLVAVLGFNYIKYYLGKRKNYFTLLGSKLVGPNFKIRPTKINLQTYKPIINWNTASENPVKFS